MILGAKYWNDHQRLHVQTNNPTEEQIRKDGLRSYLETCGPTAAVNCLDALGVNINCIAPGGYMAQPEEVLSDYLNDPVNYGKFKKIRPDLDFAAVHGNRVPNVYPLAVAEVFSVRAVFAESATWLGITEQLKNGRAVQLCLKNPGHYIAAVAYDTDTDEIIYHDSWPNRTGTDGFALRMKRTEYDANVQACIIGYDGGNA